MTHAQQHRPKKRDGSTSPVGPFEAISRKPNADGAAIGASAPNSFQLDTSGRVAGHCAGLAVWYEFGDLDPFTQGYIEALLATGAEGHDEDPNSRDRPLAFRDLAVETLARIMEDCATYDRLTAGHPPHSRNTLTADIGRAFWEGRQRSKPVVVCAELGSGLRYGLKHFPHLTPILSGDGMVRFQTNHLPSQDTERPVVDAEDAPPAWALTDDRLLATRWLTAQQAKKDANRASDELHQDGFSFQVREHGSRFYVLCTGSRFVGWLVEGDRQ